VQVLILASPFFEAALSGGWRETEPRVKKDVVVSDAVADEKDDAGDATPKESGSPEQLSDLTRTDNDGTEDDDSDDDFKSARPVSVAYSEPPPSMTASYLSSILYEDESEASWEDDDGGGEVVARLWLRDEKAQSFQDLLCHVYPRQECLISWNNVGELSATQSDHVTFAPPSPLLTHPHSRDAGSRWPTSSTSLLSGERASLFCCLRLRAGQRSGCGSRRRTTCEPNPRHTSQPLMARWADRLHAQTRVVQGSLPVRA
jgi:hypothetical protein